MQKKIDYELFENAIEDVFLEAKPIRETVSNSTVEFLHKFSVPKELQDFIASNSFDKPFKVGHIYYECTKDISVDNLENENKNCIHEKLLIIGSGLNGDPIVIDLSSLTVGFIFHDELWEDTSVKARSVHIDTGLSIGEFFWRAASQKDDFPVDAYEAEQVYGKINGR